MTNLIKNFANDESGATAIEYGLIAALIAVGLISVLGALKGNLQGTFQKVSDELGTAKAG
ncbi:Flp family type IVb pilin [Asticcacaulis sp.]|uniref:Flp family type IVb pilin n=1 Tax=Asticcacaulis sp. TaxID=1872648 RepID=UPI00391C653F